jgi:hypothetical protein
MQELDNYYLSQPEPNQGCLLALRDLILLQDVDVSAAWKYKMPFFCYRGKMFCYLWVHKKTNQPYIGFVEGKHLDESYLVQEKRSRMKIMFIEPTQDIPVKIIKGLLKKALLLYKEGVVKVK